MAEKVQRNKGERVKNKHRKWMYRLYLEGSWTFDLIPCWWKYVKRDTPQKTVLDKHSYAVKWGFFTLRLEKVRMGLRQ